MPLDQALALLALVTFAIYRQTCVAPVIGAKRFNISLVYAALAALGVVAWGWSPPRGLGWAFLMAGFTLSAMAGTVRGFLTRVWLAADGRVMRRGTGTTVGLFFAMLAIKVAMGVYARSHLIADGADLGEILMVVAIMSAVQAEIVFRRARALSGRQQLA